MDDDDKHHTVETNDNDNHNNNMVETTTATTTTSTTTFISCVVPVITTRTLTTTTGTTTTGITSHENHDPPPPLHHDDIDDNLGGGYHIGQFVSVASRTSPGINQPGGIGRITNIRHVTNDDVNLHHHDDHHHIRLSVKYVLDGRHEKNIAWMYVQPYTDLDDDDTAPPTDPTMNTSQQRHPSSVLVPHRHRTKLRNRNLLLGRCTYCGSLRTDCQSQCVVRDTRPTVLRRHHNTHHHSVTTTTTTTHHVDDVDHDNDSNDSSRSGNRSHSRNSSSCIDDSDSSSNSEAQYDSMIQQHRKEFLQYKRLVPSKGSPLPVATTSTRRRRNDRSYTTTTTVSPLTLQQRKYHHRRRIATDVLATIAMEEEEEDAVVVVVKHQTSNDERQNHCNLGQNVRMIGTDHCDRRSSSSDKDDEDEEDEESDPYGNLDHLSLQQLAALPPPLSKRVIRPRRPLRPPHHRTRQRHHDAVWNPLLWWNSSTNTVDRPLDANDSRENDGIGHDDDTHNNPISDTTRTSFIQPEGNATRLPKDVPDTTQSLSYAQVLSMFDTTMHRITTVDIPHAQQQLRQFERDYQQSYRDRIHSHESQYNSNNNNSNHHNDNNNINGHHSSDLNSSVESLLLKR